MLTNTHALTVETLSDAIFRVIRDNEGYERLPYRDGTSASIGYGANFTYYANIIFNEMGITNAADRQAYMNIMNSGLTTPTMRNLLNEEYRNRTRDNTAIFGLNANNEQGRQQARNIFDDIIEDKQRTLHPLLGIGTVNPLIVLESYEYVAIMSMYYNGETTVGNGLRNALANNNRAEAWYEIRYNSNSDGANAARRVKESNMFGLYNTTPNNVTTDEAKTIMRMFTIHKNTIPGRRGITEEETAYPTAFADGEEDILSQIQPAKDYLIRLFVTNEGIDTNINGDVLVGAGLESYSYKTDDADNIYVTGTDNNDLIFGNHNNDVLIGDAGNDVMYAGTGNDVIYGGEGNDTCVVNNADIFIISNLSFKNKTYY